MINHLIISLPMIICMGWTIFFLIRYITRNGEMPVTGMLLLFYTTTSILYADHWMYFSGVPTFIGEWTYKIVNLCVYPIYYAYLRALAREKQSYEVPLLLFPALVTAIFFPIAKHCEWGGYLTIFDSFARICFAFQVVWVWYRGYVLLKKTTHRMDDTYSDDRSHLLKPVNVLLQFFGLTAAVSMIFNIIGREFFHESVLITLPALVMTALLYGLGYVAAHTSIPRETITSEEPQPQEPTPEETDQLIHQIGLALREQKLYASPDLTIQDLANAVRSNRTYVSQCINRRTGLSFSQLVTRYRVENAQQILRKTTYTSDHDAIRDAIIMSGFKSDQTFYRSFKEFTGLTPLQFRHKNR